MGTLGNVTALLSSKLVRERQEALVQLRSAFATDRAVEKLQSNDWVVLFASLFEAFSKEKEACIKKNAIPVTPSGAGAAPVRRLAEVASAIRFLIEKTAKLFNNTLMRQTLDHLFTNIRHKNMLIDAIALDYVKAMKCVLSWAPNLERLDDGKWISFVELCFNVILEDSFKTRLEDEEAQPDEPPSAEQSDEEEAEAEATSSSRKRRLAEPSRTSASPAPTSARSLPVSLEKIEFASLLSMLLRSPNAPITSQRHLFLPAAILNRLERFLVQYPADTSLHHDYLTALSATLSQVVLNQRKLSAKFAKATWPALVGMWSTKNQRLKENLVVILRMLFPYFTSALDEGEYDDGLSRLWKLLDGEAQNRWGVDSLSMDSLRFELADEQQGPSADAFVARTFRYGWHFESNQALAWAILELHADCGEKLYRLSESIHAIGGQGSKRRKITNPIDTLLSSIRSSSSTRTFHFQALLFFIDRHWPVLHAALQQQVIRSLTHCLSDDDPSTQSWAFVCLAAIAHIESCSTPAITESDDSRENHWDTVWTFAMRRANVPAVCRAACHAAQILLHHRKALLSSQRMLAEIETLAKDLDVQGPSAPYDSVCKFLVLCMRIASQDVNLYRLNLEDKVLSWLVDNWRPSGVTRRLPPYSVQDILDLLGAICSFSQHVGVICDMSLPDCAVVIGMKENAATAVIRDFSLYAKLPAFRKPAEVHVEQKPPTVESIDSYDITPPSPRERKISSFFLKVLDVIIQDGESQKDILTLPSAEKIRSIMDFSVAALLYESISRVNGVQPNRRVIQAACKVIAHTLPLLSDQRWTLGDLVLLLESFDPLHMIEPRKDVQRPLEVLLPPGKMTGIRTEVLRTLVTDGPSPQAQTKAFRRTMQQSLFRSSDIQDVSTSVIKTMRSILQTVVREAFPPPDRKREVEQTRDGFSGLRTSREGTPFFQVASNSVLVRSIMDTCFSVIATFPLLQSSSGEPTRDRELMQWFEDDVCQDDSHETFFAVLPSLMLQVADRTLNLSASSLTSIFEWLGLLIRTYNYKRNDGVKTLIARFLQSTMHIWLDPAGHSEASALAPHLVKWLIDNCVIHDENDPTNLSWRSRESILLLLSDYIERDPTQSVYTDVVADAELLPHMILTRFGNDDDIRVRARAATANARLQYHINALKLRPMDLYTLVRVSLSADAYYFDLMITRFLTLANMMIVSSAVRRGPYWHLLELSLVSCEYNHHLETILQAVTSRIGMPSRSTLFDIYAPQIAYSVIKSKHDFLRFPPRLLGFRDRRECADRAFPACTTVYLASAETAEDLERGRRQFFNHCRAVQKNVDDGLLACLPEIIGKHVVHWVSRHISIRLQDYPDPDSLWRPSLKELYEGGTFQHNLHKRADGVVTTIIRSLQDNDFSPSGAIAIALEKRSASIAQTFQELSSRRVNVLEDYESSASSFSVDVVLRALDWFNQVVPYEGDCAITYHVLHRLFSALNEAPLLDEQVRLVNSLCLWIALHRDHFRDSTLVQVLLNGTLNFIGQIDLVRDTQSILDWIFRRLYDNLDVLSLAEALLRIARAAHDYSKGTTEDTAQLGSQLIEWAEEVATSLVKHRSLSSAVRTALLAWPRDLPQQLQNLVKEPSLRDLQTILSDERISSNKFRMVRQIHALAQAGQYEEDSFSRHDFWRLRQYIPSRDSLNGEELQAFVSLLVSQRGQINGLDRETTPRHTACVRYLQQRKKDSKAEQSLLARKAIISSLFALLGDPSAPQVHLAFTTLRALATVTLGDLAGSNGWPIEHLAELKLLQAYTHQHNVRIVPDLSQLLESDNATRLSEDYPRWVTSFATSLSDVLSAHDPFYGPLALILETDDRFAEQILPILVHIYLYTDTARMDDSSAKARDIISVYFSKLLSLSTSSTACRKTIVDIVLHLREWPPPDFRDPLAYDKWLSVDFIVLSQNAVACGAYTTALLFLELATEYANAEQHNSQAKEEVLYQIYSRIDEPDGFYAISTQDVHGLLVKRLHHENQWDKAFQFHGAALQTQNPDSDTANGVLRSLRAFGFDSLAMTALHSMPGAETLVDRQMTYELGWRAGIWDLPQVPSSDDSASSLYLALRAVHRERETRVVNNVVMEQLHQQMDRLKRLGPENLVEIRQVSQTLMCLDEIRRWCQADEQERLRPDTPESGDGYFWETPRPVEFSDLEATLATRISLLRSTRDREERTQIGDMSTPLTERLKAHETSYLLILSRAARDAGNSQIAINSVVKAQNLNGRQHFEVACEFANVLWLTKEPKMATEFLKGLLSTPPQLPPKTDSTSRATLLALMGNWASQACLEKPADIKSHYFDMAVDSMQDTTPLTQSSVYHEYATFSERQYHAIAKSPDVLRLKVYIERKTAEIRSREDHLSQLRLQGKTPVFVELQGYKNKAEKLLATDKALYTEYLKSRNTFLQRAIEMYSRTLAGSDKYDDDAAIRLCSLWFANFDSTDDDLPSKIGTALALVPSHKFVFLAHQLSARLSEAEIATDRSSNQANLQRIVLRMCKDHPFHALFPVYCLQGDTVIISNTRPTRQSLGSQGSQTIRVGAAASMLARLGSDASCAPRIAAVQDVCFASLQWAKYGIKNQAEKNARPKPAAIPKNLRISQLANVQVPVITKHTPLDPTGRYENCVWIARYDPIYATAGGINLPKICYCIGSDGQKYKQLFKGEGGDDLRQDAVMEQVFDLVNILLRNDRESTRRNLRIRGYKVIPLASQAGVLQFVENTSTFNDWLPKAHMRYHPNDIRPTDFYQTLYDFRRGYGSPDKVDPVKMTALFLKLRKRFHPVMRHYFTEATKNPSEWFRMRLYYARSVATTSIVGHMIGLGDRHLSNILLDKRNGEVIHIDLGIAFEQGKLLPCVERVPFRLTADMVDGLGSTGTQGVFQRCAEHTLRVLRDRSDVILTVLEVFKYDPLHSWTASEVKLQGVQSNVRNQVEESSRDGADEALNHIIGFNVSTASGADEAADRALNAVARKLDKSLSVEFTVNELIAEATDVDNLGNMYPGWGPHY